MQVSFGVHEDEELAARQYDRALLIEKGRAAKTNFPLPDYEKEAKEFEDFVTERCALWTLSAVAIGIAEQTWAELNLAFVWSCPRAGPGASFTVALKGPGLRISCSNENAAR